MGSEGKTKQQSAGRQGPTRGREKTEGQRAAVAVGAPLAPAGPREACSAWVPCPLPPADRFAFSRPAGLTGPSRLREPAQRRGISQETLKQLPVKTSVPKRRRHIVREEPDTSPPGSGAGGHPGEDKLF